MDNKVVVLIAGEKVSLSSSERPEYLHALAGYIDKKIKEIKSHNATAIIDDRLRTLLIALNIADDYYKANEKFSRLEVMHTKQQEETNRQKLEIDRLKKQINTLTNELNNAKSDLQDYIDAFDEANASGTPEAPVPSVKLDDNIVQFPIQNTLKKAAVS